MGFAATAKFPTAVAQVGDLLNQSNKLPNGIEPALSINITSSQTSFILNAGTGSVLPTDNFVVVVDDEVMFVGQRTVDTLSSIVRGYEGSLAATHNAGVNVDGFITALSHNQLAVEVNAIETALGASMANVLTAILLGAPNGIATLDGTTNVPASQLTYAVLVTEVGAANGVASLDGTGKVPLAQLPSGAGGVQVNQVNTWTAKQTFTDSSTTAGINLPPSAAPSVPVSGDVYIDSASFLFGWYANGAWQYPEMVSHKGAANGYAPLNASSQVPSANLPGVVLLSTKDQANGYAGLDGSGHLDVGLNPYFPAYRNATLVRAQSNVTTAQSLMSWTVPAGYLDNTSRTIRFTAIGNFTAAVSCNLTMKIVFYGYTDIIVGIIPVSAAAGSWRITGEFIRNTTGTGGVFSSCGTVSVCQGAPTAPQTTAEFETALNLTVGISVTTTAAFSVANSGNWAQQFLFLCESLTY